MVKIKSGNILKIGKTANVYVVAFDERLKPLAEELKEKFQGLDCNKLEFCHFNELKAKIDDEQDATQEENASSNETVEDRHDIVIEMHQENERNPLIQEIEDDSNLRNEIRENQVLYGSEFIQQEKEKFQSTLESIAETLSKNDTKSIVMIDELPLHLVSSIINGHKKENQQYLLDLSYLNKYENVEFVLCINPWGYSRKFQEYEVEFPPEPWEKQHYQTLKHLYRNNKPILEFKRFFQANDTIKIRTGYPKIEMNLEVLPPLLDPLNGVGVIWAHFWDESERSRKAYLDKISCYLKEIKEPVTILHGGVSRAIPKESAQQFYLDYARDGLQLNEPCEEYDFNGKEADVILYFTDGDLNLQTISRARQLLVIISEDTSSIFNTRFYNRITDRYLDEDGDEEVKCIKIMNKAVKKKLVKKLLNVNNFKIFKASMMLLLWWLFFPILFIVASWRRNSCGGRYTDYQGNERYELQNLIRTRTRMKLFIGYNFIIFISIFSIFSLLYFIIRGDFVPAIIVGLCQFLVSTISITVYPPKYVNLFTYCVRRNGPNIEQV